MIEKTQGSAPKFAAASAGGTVSISGLPDLGLSGSLAFETNQLGRSINTTIAPLSGPAIPLVFETQDSVQRFGGSLTLDVPGFTRLTGKFGFEKGTAATPQKLKFAATEVSAFLGHNAGTADTSDDIGVQISGARLGGVFFKGTTQNTYAFDALGTAATKNIPGLTVEGLLAARINTTGAAVNETVNVPGGDPVPVVFAENENDAVFSGRVTADAAGFASIDAAFSVTKSTEQLTIAATDVTAFVGAGGSGIKVTDAKLGAVINTAAGKFALVAEGAVKEQNLTGLTLGGNAALRINTLGAAITQTISTPGGDVTIDFPNADQVLRVQGSVKIGVGGFVDAGGDLVVEKRVSGDNTALLIQASDVSAFLGTGGDTADTADDMGVRLTTGAMDLRIFKNTISGVSSYALAARGSAQLVGIPSIIASGTLIAQKSTLTESILLDFGNQNAADDLNVAPGTTEFGGAVTLSITGFTALTGKFGFQKETAGTTTKIKLAATDVTAFLGTTSGTVDTADDVGVEITSARLGAVLYRKAGINSYAFNASGTAALKNVDGLTLSGDLAARVNTTGAAVNETVNVPGGDPVPVVFAENEDDAVFSGRVTADAAGFASIDAAFSVAKSTEQLTIAATDVTAFVGAGGSGIKVTDAKLGAVI
ncbi:MAG: hypothetical protein ACK48Y_18070, partial [Planctomyces sp.]